MRSKGVVKWFDGAKGFGFITPDAGGRDAFVHYSDIQGEGFRCLAEGNRVEFDLEDSGRGPHAINVIVL